MPHLSPITPGELLREEFLDPMGITAYRLAKEIDVPQTRISSISRAPELSQLTPTCACAGSWG